MIVVSIDVDGTMEFGEPPGPVTVELVRQLVDAGLVVGCASDRTRTDQEETWAGHGIALAFVGGKHHLDTVRERFPAERYVHVGDTHVDAHFAGLHGFEFLNVDDPAEVLALLRALDILKKAEPVSRSVLLIFVGLQLGMIMSTLDGTIVSTALPTISGELGHESLRSWVITSYLLAQVATMPLYGKLGDLYGRKRVFVIAISIFTVGSMLSGAAGTMEQLLGARALQGVGAGGIGALAMAIVADIVPARQLGRWLGYQGAIFACASLIGPLAGGLFVDNLSWRWAFYVNVPFAALEHLHRQHEAALPVPADPAHARLRRRRAASPSPSRASCSPRASVGAPTTGARPRSSGSSWRWSGSRSLFVARERRAPEPVLPLRILGTRVVRIAAGLNTTSGAIFASGIYFIPVFVQQVKGLSATESGFLLVPFMFTTAFTTLLAGRAVERTGRYRTWPILGAVIATASVLVLTTLGLDTPAWLIALYGASLGAGVGFVMQTSLLALQNGAETRDLGVATSTALLSRILGSTLGVAVCSAALQSQLPSGGLDAADYASALPAVYIVAVPIALGHVRARAATPTAAAPREHPLRLRASGRRRRSRTKTDGSRLQRSDAANRAHHHSARRPAGVSERRSGRQRHADGVGPGHRRQRPSVDRVDGRRPRRGRLRERGVLPRRHRDRVRARHAVAPEREVEGDRGRDRAVQDPRRRAPADRRRRLQRHGVRRVDQRERRVRHRARLADVAHPDHPLGCRLHGRLGAGGRRAGRRRRHRGGDGRWPQGRRSRALRIAGPPGRRVLLRHVHPGGSRGCR